MSILKLATGIAEAMLNVFFVNYSYMFLCALLILFLKSQYQKYLELQGNVYENQVKPFRDKVEKIILTGLLAGFAASFLAVSVGINIEAEAVRYLFFIMLILLPLDMRYANVSYAAGILAVVSLIFGYPEVNIPSLIGLVAILQLVGSILIFIDRKGDSIPVFIRHKDEITGAFLIRKFWMIPIVFFTYIMRNSSFLFDFTGELPMLFKLQLLSGGAFAIGLDCLIALLCYSDIAITKHPEKKCAEGAAMVFVHGCVLFALALTSEHRQWLVYVSIAVCVLGYEVIHFISEHSELRGEPLYSPVSRGLRVMDVLTGSHAQKMGLERGDIILSINNKDIQTDAGVKQVLSEYPTFTWVRVLGWDGKEREIEYRYYPKGYDTLGIVSVPREKEVTYNISYFERMSIIRNIVNRFKGIDRPI